MMSTGEFGSTVNAAGGKTPAFINNHKEVATGS